MTLFSANIPDLRQAIQDITQPIVEAYQENFEPDPDDEGSPSIVADGLLQLCDILQSVDNHEEAPVSNGDGEDEKVLTIDDLTRIGDYGLELFNDMGEWADKMGMEQERDMLQELILPVCIWLSRHGAELRTLEPVVDSIAMMANNIEDVQELEQMCNILGEIIDAVAPQLRQDYEQDEKLSPWRILNINRGIIATRTHNTSLMEKAFQTLTDNLPEDAPAFFREGMEQMEVLDYPDNVKAVMLKYFKEWVTPTLH